MFGENVFVEMLHKEVMLMLILLFEGWGQATGQYTKFEFNDCGSSAISINKIDLTPMPIIRPSKGNLTLNVEIKRPIGEYRIEREEKCVGSKLVVARIRLTVQAIRTVQSIVLPVSCYKVEGTKVGSCEYTGEELCRFMTVWWPQFFGANTCSSVLTAFGIDCQCPFKGLKAQTVNIVNKNIDIPDFGSPILSYFSTGDFSLKLIAHEEGSIATQPLFCGSFKYSVHKPGYSGK